MGIINWDEVPLLEMLERLQERMIWGRNPNSDWHGTKTDDPDVTVCIRITRGDLAKIIETLRRNADGDEGVPLVRDDPRADVPGCQGDRILP